MRINVPKPLTILETLLAVSVSLFGSKISQHIELSPYYVVIAFALLLCGLSIVKVWPDLKQRGKDSSAQLPIDDVSIFSFRIHPMFILILKRIPLALGILVGIFIGALTAQFVSGEIAVGGVFADYISFETHYWNDWLVADLLGIMIIVLATFKFDFLTLRDFAIGYGLGMSVASTSLFPNQISLIFNLIATPLFFLCWVYLGKGSTALWRRITLISIILQIILILMLAPPKSRPNELHGSFEAYSSGTYTVYYEHPFQSPPFLTLHPSIIIGGEDPGFMLTKQDADHFELQVTILHPQRQVSLYFDAKGTLRKDQ